MSKYMYKTTLPCGHLTENDALFIARDYITGDVFPIKQCDKCGLVETDVFKGKFAVDRYYPPTYYGGARRFVAKLSILYSLFSKRRIRLLENEGRSIGRVLDIGCGPGWFLDHLRRMGVEAVGTELSEDAAYHAKTMLGLNVAVGGLEGLSVSYGLFDSICIWHVLEHVFSPDALLHTVNKLLKPKGVLLISVPNIASYEAQFGRESWFHLDVPRHLIHFCPTSLERLLKSNGFRVVKKKYFAPEYDYFSFVQTLLNKMGVSCNLLFIILRARNARDLDIKTIKKTHFLMMILLAPLLGFLAFLWVPIMAFLHKSSTITFVSEKI